MSHINESWTIEENKRIGVRRHKGSYTLQSKVINIISTFRYRLLTVPFWYGNEINELLGSGIDDIPDEIIIKYIKDALSIENEIIEVKDFIISRYRENLRVSFTVITIYGEFIITDQDI